MKKKFKTILSLSLFSTVLIGSVSAFTKVHFTVYDEYSFSKIESPLTHNQNLGYLDSKISNSLITQPLVTDIIFSQYYTEENFKSLDISKLSNFSFYKYKDERNANLQNKNPNNLKQQNICNCINEENIQKDIFYSFKKVFNDNQKISLSLNSSSIKYTANKLSFNYVLNVKKLEEPMPFSFNNISFFVPQGNNFDITFKTNNQPISVNLKGNNIYWSVSNVNVLINDKPINEFKTFFTFNSQINSYSIPYQFTKNKYEKIIKNSINNPTNDETDSKKQIYESIKKNKELSLNTISLLSKVFKQLEKNSNVSTFLSDLSNDFIEYLVKMEILPEVFQEIIISLLKNEKSVSEIIDTYKEEISDFLIQFVSPEYKKIINKKFLITWLIPNLLKNNPLAKHLLNYIVPDEFVSLVEKLLIILANSSIKPLDFIKIILESDELNNFMSKNNELVKYIPVINLLEAIFSNQNQILLKVLSDNKKLLFDIVVNMLPVEYNIQQSFFSQVFNTLFNWHKKFSSIVSHELITLSEIVNFYFLYAMLFIKVWTWNEINYFSWQLIHFSFKTIYLIITIMN